MDTAAFGHLLLRQAGLLARTAKVSAKGAGHARDSPRWGLTSPEGNSQIGRLSILIN